MSKNFGIVELYCGESGKIGFYNNQEIGIAKAMRKLGYNCFVFYPDKANKQIVEEQYDGVTVVKCPAKAIGVHSYYDWNILKQYKIDYAQIDSDNQLFVPNVIKYCRKKHIKSYNYIGTIKTDSNNVFKRIVSNIFLNRNINIYKTSKCFVKNKELFNELKRKGINDIELANVGLDTSLIPTITNDINTIKTELNLPLNKKILLFVGRMEEYKRPFQMIEVVKKVDNCVGIMIGQGSLSKEIDEKINRELSNKLIRIERIENKDIHRYYKVADYFLNFNEKEIFGMSMLEAMYQGCNVIAIDSPGASEIIDSESGYIVENINEMIELIKRDIRKDKNSIVDRIKNTFSWETTVNKFDSYLKQ